MRSSSRTTSPRTKSPRANQPLPGQPRAASRSARQLITTPGQLGQILSSRRKALKLTQGAVAAKLGTVQSRLSALEENPAAITLDRLIALANLLGLELVVQDKTAVPASEW